MKTYKEEIKAQRQETKTKQKPNGYILLKGNVRINLYKKKINTYDLPRPKTKTKDTHIDRNKLNLERYGKRVHKTLSQKENKKHK